MTLIRKHKATLWLKTRREALSQKQRKVLLYTFFVSYLLLTLWILIEGF